MPIDDYLDYYINYVKTRYPELSEQEQYKKARQLYIEDLEITLKVLEPYAKKYDRDIINIIIGLGTLIGGVIFTIWYSSNFL